MSATKVQFRRWGLTVAFQITTPKQARQGCATRLRNPQTHLLQIGPLQWTLTFQSVGTHGRFPKFQSPNFQFERLKS